MKRVLKAGRKYDRLTLKEIVKKGNRYYWKCVCDCGKNVTIRKDNISRGATKSCGCYRRELLTDFASKNENRKYSDKKNIKQSVFFGTIY